jgi:hypothetical protein
MSAEQAGPPIITGITGRIRKGVKEVHMKFPREASEANAKANASFNRHLEHDLLYSIALHSLKEAAGMLGCVKKYRQLPLSVELDMLCGLAANLMSVCSVDFGAYILPVWWGEKYIELMAVEGLPAFCCSPTCRAAFMAIVSDANVDLARMLPADFPASAEQLREMATKRLLDIGTLGEGCFEIPRISPEWLSDEDEPSLGARYSFKCFAGRNDGLKNSLFKGFAMAIREAVNGCEQIEDPEERGERLLSCVKCAIDVLRAGLSAAKENPEDEDEI